MPDRDVRPARRLLFMPRLVPPPHAGPKTDLPLALWHLLAARTAWLQYRGDGSGWPGETFFLRWLLGGQAAHIIARANASPDPRARAALAELTRRAERDRALVDRLRGGSHGASLAAADSRWYASLPL